MRNIIFKYKNINEKKKDYIRLFIVYLLSQMLLLFVSGRWWDDWCSFNISPRGMWHWATEAGRPSIFIFYLIPNILPEFAYRWITFAVYFLTTILFYNIIDSIFNPDSKETLLTTLLFISIPAYDARIGMVMFPYSIGIMLFLFGFYFLIQVFAENKHTITKRRISLIAFFLSFCLLNANVFLYCLVFLFIMVKERKVLSCIKHFDYFCLPFIFTGLKMLLFPTKGFYENYNQITAEGIKYFFKNFIVIDINTCKKILFSLMNVINERPYVGVLLVFFVILLILGLCFNKKSTNKVINIRHELIKFLLGFITLNLAIIPYGIIRMQEVVYNEYFSGRDSVLVPLGTALIFSALFNIVFNEFGKKIIIFITVFLGICYFNFHYINYQTETFWYSGFQENIRNNQYIKHNDVFVVITPDTDRMNSRVYYVYNGLAEEVFGEETRLFMDGTWLIPQYLSEWSHDVTEREWYNMKDFCSSDDKIDGVICYSNNISIRKALYLKYLEIIDQTEFVKQLTNNSSFEIYYPGSEEYNQYIVSN